MTSLKFSNLQFDNILRATDSLNFLGIHTDITKALSSAKDIYTKTNTAVVMLTDGNQTIGNDYAFYGTNSDYSVYPIVMGDTTTYEDVRIDRVNVNRFAFLKNKYPIEAFVSYQGQRNVEATVSIMLEGRRIYNQNVSFSNSKNSVLISTLLEAGFRGYQIDSNCDIPLGK